MTDSDGADRVVKPEPSMAGTVREPPQWVPRATLACIPTTFVATALAGLVKPVWAISGLSVGVFALLFLAGWWASTPGTRGFAIAVAVAVLGSLAFVGGVVGLSVVAELAIDGEDDRDTIEPLETEIEEPRDHEYSD